MPARDAAGEPSDIVGWMADSPLVAVQVVTYRTRRWLERCVDTVVSDLGGSSMEGRLNLLDLLERHDVAAGKTDAQYLLILSHCDGR